jgi:transposase
MISPHITAVLCTGSKEFALMASGSIANEDEPLGTVPRGIGYPEYVRNRVLFDGRTVAERARAHGVSTRTVYRYDALFAETGSVRRRPSRAGRHRSVPPEADEYLRMLTAAAPSASRNEMREALLSLTGFSYSASTLTRRWQAMGFTLKRLRTYSRSRDESRRVRYWSNGPEGPHGVAGVYGIPSWQFIDMDEAGFELKECDRAFGHAPKGQRASAPGWVGPSISDGMLAHSPW